MSATHHAMACQDKREGRKKLDESTIPTERTFEDNIFGSEEPILVKSRKPPAEKLISSFFFLWSILKAVPTIVNAIR